LVVRILIDTNIIISALFFDKKPLELLEKCIQSKLGQFPVKIEYIIPQYVRDETHDVIKWKFDENYTDEKRLLLDSIFESAENVTYEDIQEYIQEAEELIGSVDETDVPVIAAVLASRPDYLITGNNHLKKLNKINGTTEVISPSEFLIELEKRITKFELDIYG